MTATRGCTTCASSANRGHRAGGLALRRHHVSLNNLVVDDEVRSVTPCFVGAEPATAPGLGSDTLRPLERVEDLARELVRSLSPELRDVAVLLDRPPSDIVGGNRPRVADGAQMLLLPDIWSGRVTEPRLRDLVEAMTAAAEAATGHGSKEHRRLALTSRPGKCRAARWTQASGSCWRRCCRPTGDGSRRAGRSGRPGAGAPGLGRVVRAGEPHYYRLQGPRLLTEWDNTTRDANREHSAWRDPEADFGTDVLAEHRHAHHGG